MSEQPVLQKNGKLFRWLAAIVVLLCFALAAWAYPQLPARVPAHWNAAGEIDGYSGPLQAAFLLPGIILAVFAMMFVLPHVDPKRSNYKLMGKVYWLFALALILFLGLFYANTILSALGITSPRSVPRLALSGLGLLFIILGNYMGKVKYNYTFGLRTPWTLASEEVWYKTHRVTAPFWMLGGIVLLSSAFLPATWGATVMLLVIGALALGPTLYSYILFRRLESKD